MKGPTLTELIRVGGKRGIRTDTGGWRKRYRVWEEVARIVGLID